MKVIRDLQKKLLQQKLEVVKIKGEFLLFYRRLLKQGLNDELKEYVQKWIEVNQPDVKNLYNYRIAMKDIADTETEEEINRILDNEKQRLKLEGEKEKLLQDIVIREVNDGGLGFRVVVNEAARNDPGTVIQRS